MQAITIAQWHQLRQTLNPNTNVVYTDAELAQWYTIQTAAPPPAPPVGAGGNTTGLSFNEGKFGAAEGRHPEDGQHEFTIKGFDQHTSHRDGCPMLIVEYVVTKSSNPANEIGGVYSKAYATRPRANDYGKSRDAMQGLLRDIAVALQPGSSWVIGTREWDTRAREIVAGAGVGVKGKLTTRTQNTQAGFPFTYHDWSMGGTIVAPRVAPTLTAPPLPGAAPVPPMPSVAPPVPPMPGAGPGAPQVPPSTPGGAAYDPNPKPPGWVGPWPPGGDF